jgi:hypothetical protein
MLFISLCFFSYYFLYPMKYQNALIWHDNDVKTIVKIQKWILTLVLIFFFLFQTCFSLYAEWLKWKNTYLFIINLVITNKPGKKTKIPLIVTVRFFFLEEKLWTVI